MNNDTQTIIGVDVGSGSVRAGIFNLQGKLLAHATREITLFRSAGNPGGTIQPPDLAGGLRVY